jgi:uncharacterized protein YjbI with pentapeptide repeats
MKDGRLSVSNRSDLRARWETPDGISARARVIERLQQKRADLLEPELGFPTEGWHADFSGMELRSVAFADGHLEEANFDRAFLSGVDMNRANLRSATFRGARLVSCLANGSDYTGASFYGATIESDLGWSTCERVSFRNVRFRRASLNSVHLRDVDFEGATFEDVGVSYSTLSLGFLRWQDREGLREALNLADWLCFFTQPEPEGADHIGRPGIRPCPPTFRAIACREGPNAGLLVADPSAPRLIQALGPYPYEDYAWDLGEVGIEVGRPDEGYVLRDRAGHRFHPVYDLLSLTRVGVKKSVWTLPEAAVFREKFQRYLGGALMPRSPRALLRPEDALRPRMLPGGIFPVVALEGYRLTIHPNVEHLEETWAHLGMPVEALIGPRLAADGGQR